MRRRQLPLQQWDIRDPGAALEIMTQRLPLQVGTVALGILACEPGGAVRFVDACIAHAGPAQPDEMDARELMCTAAVKLAGDRGSGAPRYTPMIVICREGRVIDTEDDWFWFYAWRYSNHFADLFVGDHYVLTQHGWTGLLDDRADFEPRLSLGGRSLHLSPD